MNNAFSKFKLTNKQMTTWTNFYKRQYMFNVMLVTKFKPANKA